MDEVLLTYNVIAGTHPKGAGGGPSPCHADGEDHEVVVRLHCQLERKVEQGD